MTHKISEHHDVPGAGLQSQTSWLDVVRKKVDDLRFGSVQIIIHEGRVTQVESLEKTRFPSCQDERRSP